MSLPTVVLPAQDEPAGTGGAELVLPSELLIALPKEDALDSFALRADVELEDILNELIPNEHALSQTPLLGVRIKSLVQETRSTTAFLSAQLAKDQHPDNMSDIQELIGDLLTQITAIRDAATESEVVVRDITRDIQSLDLAKKNLIASMNALKRFQMLVNAFDQLTRLAKSRQYRETSQALSAVKELSQFFKAFSNVDRVASVHRGVADVQRVLRAQVTKEFEEAFAPDSTRLTKPVGQLADAALVIDALGDDARAALLSWYTGQLLRDYRKVFGSSSEAGQLDNVARRFAWFRRISKTHEEEHAAIFPPAWKVGAVLTAGFCEVTRDDLKSVLTRAAPGLQVSLLLDALNETSEFESQMAAKYRLPFESIAALSPLSSGRTGLAVPLSTVFEPYLGVFVDAQDRTLHEMLSTFATRRTSLSSPETSSNVLSSSTELFYFYRETLEKCAKLSTRQPLADLAQVYKKWLKVYAEDVLAGTLNSRPERRSGEGRPSSQELASACLVLNTAEYCSETASQLEDRLRERIHPDFKSRVSFATEKDTFITAISASIVHLLREAELTIDEPFNQMLRSPWKEAELVSAESPYARVLVSELNSIAAFVREGVEQKKYARSFFDKLVGLALAKFTQTIVRCRPISQTGAEQILLDLQLLKQCLLQLPQASDDAGAAPTTYTRYVTKSVTKLDTLLKVIMTPDHPAEDFVSNYLTLVPCQSFSDFQKVLDLKGVRRTEQNLLSDTFLAATSNADGLSDTSFLSTLDMDPNASQAVAGTGSSPMLANSSLNFFGTTPMMPGGSRDGSRTATPQPGTRPGTGDGIGEGTSFKRLGQKIGLASRLFSGAGREARVDGNY